MVYCVHTDVTAIINTTLSPAQITAIIQESDAVINRRLGSQSTSDYSIRKLSKLLTAMEVKTQQPNARTIGEYKETHNPISVWERWTERAFKLYRTSKLVAGGYQVIDEDDRYTEDRVE